MISMGWGSIQEWGSNNVDTVIAKSNCAKAHIVMVALQIRGVYIPSRRKPFRNFQKL